MTDSELLGGALAAAARGWHVFPLHPDSKRPARPTHRAADCEIGGFGGPTGSDPWCRDGHAGWEERATTDSGRIRAAWSSHPYGIGIACGPSGLVVIDLDTAKHADVAPDPWAKLGAKSGAEVLTMIAGDREGEIAPTWTVRTVSGGTHLYYRAPGGCRFGNTAGSVGWLIDTRASGGYVVAPPTSIAGQVYEVSDDRPTAPLPGWLAEVLSGGRSRPGWAAQNSRETSRGLPNAGQPRQLRRRPPYVAAAVNGEVRKVMEARPGRRNHVLFCAAVALGQLVAGDALDEHQAAVALTDAAAIHIAAGAFTYAEALATIRSGFHAGARTPRSAA